MKNFCALLTALVASAVVVGCAHSPDFPQVDRSFNYQPTDFEKRVGYPPCKTSVPLTHNEALRAAELIGVSNLDQSSDWSEMIAISESGDQLRYVWCIPKGPGGVVFFALYRGVSVIKEVHFVMLD